MARFVSTEDAAEETLQDLLFLKGKKPGTGSNIRDFFAKKIINDCASFFLADPNIVIIEPPVIIIGSMFGDFYDLMVIFETYGYPPAKKYLFLGDIVGQGPNSLECLFLVCCLKMLHPSHVFLIRGYNEIRSVNIKSHFYKESVRRYGEAFWERCNSLFNHLPLSAVIGDSIYCVSSSVHPDFTSINELRSLIRPFDADQDYQVTRMLSSVPVTEIGNWAFSNKNTVLTFTFAFVCEFLERNHFDVLIRSHSYINGGFEFPFEGDKRVLSLSSRPSYDFSPEKAVFNHNKAVEIHGCVLEVDVSLSTTIRTVFPLAYEYREYYLTKTQLKEMRMKEPAPLRQGPDGSVQTVKRNPTKKKSND